MEDEMELTWEVMVKGLDGAVSVLCSLTDMNPRVDFIALKMAEKVYRSITSFPATRRWEDLEADSEIASAIDRFVAEIEKEFPDYWKYCT